ncbi:hypothetical protein K438DRAFT_200738 [Mycena galopus ATCC 62051]|nr:hypothetical protein K438DRAFT_200738 [Mycena galopus ATCC 62051]
MTSYRDERYDQDLSRGKKRLRVQRACDVCRRKKIGCGGSHTQGGKCAACVVANLECTYESTVKRPPPKSYIALETQLENSEALVRQLRSELANARTFNTSTNTPSPNSSTSDTSAGQQNLDVPSAALCTMLTALHSLTAPPAAPPADDVLDLLTSKFEVLRVSAVPMQNGFFGTSSGAVLIDAAFDLKGETSGTESQKQVAKDSSIWNSRRALYWTWKPPQQDDTMRPTSAPFQFPPYLILTQLIEFYFTRQNIYLPLLNMLIFKRGVAEGLHLRDNGFAATVVLVCAIGSRWSTESCATSCGLDSGWALFNQVQLTTGSHLMHPTTLYDLQQYCLASLFVSGCMPQASFTLTGFGLRLALDLGLHRSKGNAPSVEGELYKRAFWVLMYLDTSGSCILGRICMVRYSDFDIELPLEVDDEYWEDPIHPFQQPAHRPSRITYFNTLMRLTHIMGFSVQVLYPLTKVRTMFSLDDAWIEKAVMELDSTLNVWRNQIPDHLRWDPKRVDPVFFDQSVFLHCSFCFLQITIHRPFVPLLRSSRPTMLPSLAICTTAARACANMVDIQRQRGGALTLPQNLNSIFTAGLVLLLNILSRKLSGLLPEQKGEIVNVYKCIEAIRLFEGRWPVAGMFWDVMTELATVGQLSRPNAAAVQANHSPPPNVGIPPTPNLIQDDQSLTEHNPDIFSGSQHGAACQNFDVQSDPAPFDVPYAPISSSSLFSGSVPSLAPAGPDGILNGYGYADTDPTQASLELENMNVDRDIMAVWANTPVWSGVDNWGEYFSNIGELMQRQAGWGDEWAFESTGPVNQP